MPATQLGAAHADAWQHDLKRGYADWVLDDAPLPQKPRRIAAMYLYREALEKARAASYDAWFQAVLRADVRALDLTIIAFPIQTELISAGIGFFGPAEPEEVPLPPISAAEIPALLAERSLVQSQVRLIQDGKMKSHIVTEEEFERVLTDFENPPTHRL